MPAAVVAVREFIGLPCFTKPARLGSSVGVSKCTSTGELLVGLTAAFEHDKVALVETAIEGRELECAVLGNNDPLASVVGEIIPGREFYDYKAKYVEDTSGLVIPADIPSDVAEQIRDYSVRAFQAIDCAGMARVDFFYATDGRVWINEINTIPGFTPISMYPKLWEASGVGYRHLIDRLIELAFERHRSR
jgi:D-alanine-D-alanine ligase